MGKKIFICNFCAKVVKVGGIHRMKIYLVGQKGEIGPCKKVLGDICDRMQESLREFQEQKLANEREVMNPFGRSVHPFEGDMECPDIESL